MRKQFLHFLYDHKDYASFDNRFSIITKNFPEPIRFETNSSLQDGNKSENSDREREVLNLKRDEPKIVKKLFFRTTLLIPFNNFFFFFLFIILRRYRFLIYKFTNSTMNINSYTN